MRIIIKSGTTEQIICDGHVAGADKSVGPSNLRVEGPVLPQVRERLRATEVAISNRYNRRTVVRFSVTRECQSAKAAEKYAFTHQRDCQRADTLICLAEGADGSTEKLTLASAHIGNVVCEQIGVSVIVTYDIQGGALT
jgi:hypothetical protein